MGRQTIMTVITLSLWISNSCGATAAISGAVTPLAMSVQPSKNRIDRFPTDPFVRRQVRFWETVFQKYKSNSVIIHDVDDPILMIDVINFDRYVDHAGKVMTVADSDQTALVKKYIDRYNIAIERFATQHENAIKFGPIEQRLFEVYSKEPQTLTRLYAGGIKLRGQGGLADTFIAAAERAQEFLPYMESTFRKHGLPTELTRLPFVESMFNTRIKSKVGASGLWQFMPDTARQYMMVNVAVDERNNPFKATIGAAQLFKENIQELGTWPLAITAYNHGRGGMSKAAREAGTSQLGTIINNYRGPTFGFASKNFYAEFLAAVKTYEFVSRTGLVKASIQRTNSTTLTLQKSVSVDDITRVTGLPKSEIAKLNPCLTQASLGHLSQAPLPTNYELRLPQKESLKYRKLLAYGRFNRSKPDTVRR